MYKPRMAPRTAFFLTAVLYAWNLAVAIQVSPNSRCAALCLDHPEGDPSDPAASTTNTTDIVCSDHEYTDSSAGIKFKNCVDCLQESKNVSSGETDAGWFLYNVRYAVDVCLYSFPAPPSENISSPCDINYACAPFKTALEEGILDPSNDTQYGYCSADGGRFNGSDVDACVQCLQSSTDQFYLSNFLTALNAGCQQQPAAGQLLGLSGSLFTSTTVNITDPPTDPKQKVDNTTAMTTGAIVGIVVGASLLFVGGSALFFVYYRRQRAAYTDMTSDFDPRGGAASISPPLKGGFSSYEPKQASQFSDYELRAQQRYHTNGAYYDKLEEEMAARRPQYNPDPHRPGAGPQAALPAHPAYIPRAMSRNSHRSQSPQRPPPVKSNKPDSYALQVYLSVAEDAAALKMPGPLSHPPPPSAAAAAAAARAASSRGSRSPSPRASYSTPPTALRPAPPPPPPSRPAVPALTMPSVPRVRVPKKYAPPQIQVNGVSEAEAEAGASGGISGPVVPRDERRFIEDPTEARRRAHDADAATQRIVEQQAVDRRPPRAVFEERSVHTGNSSIYG